MNNIRKKINNVNNTIFIWSKNTKLFSNLFADTEQVKELLTASFSKREVASKKFAKKVWGMFPELGPEPLFDILSEEEHARSFYDNYRDHTTHQVKVFLLGLFFYEKCKVIREAINKYLENEKCILEGAGSANSFLRIWIVAALCHDIGYLFECDQLETSYNAYWKKVSYQINERLKFPLAYTKGLNVSKNTERSSIRTGTKEIQNFTDITDDSLFESLQVFCNRSSLQENEKNAIAEYYTFAQLKNTSTRPRFRDHGIVSALLVLQTWKSYMVHINEFSELNSNNGKKSLQKIKGINEHTVIYKSQIEIAAGAIALHNISKSLWNDEDMNNVCLNEFCLELEGDNALPIAFLLKFVDEIQDWDREYYRPLGFEEELLEGKDVYLNVKQGKIYLSYLTDNIEFRRPDSYIKGRYAKLKKTLQLYLNEEIVENLLHYEMILDNKADFNEQWGLQQIYFARSEAHIDYKRNGFAKNSCDIIAFGLKNFREEIGDLVKESAKNGLKIRILTMQPDSVYVKQREIEEGLAENGIKNTIIDLLKWVEKIRLSLPETIDKKQAIQVKFYDSLPLDFYCKLDERIYIGPYLAGRESRNIITYEFMEGAVWKLYTEYFEKLWTNEINGIKPKDNAYIYNVQTQEQIVQQILETFCNILVNFVNTKSRIRGIAVKYLSDGDRRKTIFFWNKAEGSQNFPEVERSYGVVGKMDEYGCPYIHHFGKGKDGTYYFFSTDGEVQPVQVQDNGGAKRGLKAILVAPIWNKSEEKIVGIVAFEFIKEEPLAFQLLDMEINSYQGNDKFSTDVARQKQIIANESVSQKTTYQHCELAKLEYLLNVSKECAKILAKVIVNYMQVDEEKLFEYDEYSS